MSKNIEMNYKTDSGYEVLYPQTVTNNISDFSSGVSSLLGNYYTKQQVDEIGNQYVKNGEISNDNLTLSQSGSNLVINNISMNAHIIIWIGNAIQNDQSRTVFFGGISFKGYGYGYTYSGDGFAINSVTWSSTSMRTAFLSSVFSIQSYKAFQIF